MGEYSAGGRLPRKRKARRRVNGSWGFTRAATDGATIIRMIICEQKNRMHNEEGSGAIVPVKIPPQPGHPGMVVSSSSSEVVAAFFPFSRGRMCWNVVDRAFCCH